MAASALLSILFLAAFSGAPLTASTFVARRIGHRGMALIIPWIAAIGLALLFGSAVYGYAKQNPENPLPMTAAWLLGMMSSGYITTLVYLIVLAVRRLPARPSDAAAMF